MSRLDTLPDEITHIIYRYSANRFPVSLLWEIEQKHARKKMEYFDKHVVDGWLFSRGVAGRRTLHEYVRTNVTEKERENYLCDFGRCKCDKMDTFKYDINPRTKQCACKTYTDILTRTL